MIDYTERENLAITAEIVEQRCAEFDKREDDQNTEPLKSQNNNSCPIAEKSRQLPASAPRVSDVEPIVEDDVRKDRFGWSVENPNLQRAFLIANELRHKSSEIRRIRNELESIQQSDDPAMQSARQALKSFQAKILVPLDGVADEINSHVPYCTCPNCKGAGCRMCNNSGWTTKIHLGLNSLFPKSLRASHEKGPK